MLVFLSVARERERRVQAAIGSHQRKAQRRAVPANAGDQRHQVFLDSVDFRFGLIHLLSLSSRLSLQRQEANPDGPLAGFRLIARRIDTDDTALAVLVLGAVLVGPDLRVSVVVDLDCLGVSSECLQYLVEPDLDGAVALRRVMIDVGVLWRGVGAAATAGAPGLAAVRLLDALE